jgi:hypothetical protein
VDASSCSSSSAAATRSGKRASWRSILLKVRESVGDSTFGVSGVRDNCFTPSGSRC